MKVIVIAPHPDDEVFGCGGTISRFASEGADVYVAIITKGDSTLCKPEEVEQGREHARQAHKLLGVKKTLFFEGIPAAFVDTVPHSKLNKLIRELIDNITPDIMFIPFIGDIHFDHRLIFESCLVAIRPNGQKIPREVYAYETLSETNWNAPMLSYAFTPNTFIDISEHLENKLKAASIFKGQIKPFPNERSLEALRALAIQRGAQVGLHAAEGFVLIRAIHSNESKLLH